jgi:holo-[acyl-carrier protein] synthase
VEIMIIGIGIDIVEKQRIRGSLERHGEKFLERILTPEERVAIPLEESRRVEYLSGRFASKEAFAKAAGSGIGKDLSWQDVMVERNNGKPTIRVSENWLQKMDPKRSLTFHVSITHERNYAVAQVIIEGP